MNIFVSCKNIRVFPISRSVFRMPSNYGEYLVTFSTYFGSNIDLVWLAP